MTSRLLNGGVLLFVALVLQVHTGRAQDWPQWRGEHRDAKVAGFVAPATWPKELTRKWSVTVGEGVATPALVDGKLYVFSREEGQEVVRCLDAETGKVLWHDKYASEGASGPSARYSGPRSTPTVAEGKVVTYGVRGTLSCYDAESGKLLWRKTAPDGYWPRFFVSSSPIVVNGLCITQVGGESDGAIVAHELASGNEKWKWAGDGAAYASPVLMTIDGASALVTATGKSLVAVGTADGKLLWQIPYEQGRYNAATPIVKDQTVIYAGPTRGTTAENLQKAADQLTSEKVWSNTDNSLQFNSPVLKDGMLYGISNTDSLFCVNAETGASAWNAPLGASSGGEQRKDVGGRGGRRGGGGGMGGGGYGSVVDAGSVLLALTPAAQLVVFAPTGQEFKQLASYKVADSPTYAYPVLSGNRLYIKDQDAVTLWTIGRD